MGILLLQSTILIHLFRYVSCRPRDQWPSTSRLLETHVVVNKPHTTTSQKTTKQRHHGPPNPPAPGGSNLTGECDCCISRDRSGSFQSGDVTFIDETNKFSILLTNILHAAARRARGQKVFEVIACAFLRGRRIEMTCTDPSYSPISFLP
jgi:hypothetical protein